MLQNEFKSTCARWITGTRRNSENWNQPGKRSIVHMLKLPKVQSLQIKYTFQKYHQFQEMYAKQWKVDSRNTSSVLCYLKWNQYGATTSMK
ncbi:hypothetical protein BC830DRAFT_1144624 [Chytriomyces sp. MP71]|nr:hypothetical protein BC830DRAFT_1144624 [Chytriomyces sp. MP71]